MKKNLLRWMSLLLIAAMTLCAAPGLAGDAAEIIADLPASAEQPAVTLAPETTAEPENTVIPDTSAEPGETMEPDVTMEPEASAAPEASAEPTEVPTEPTENPEEGLTTSPVNNATPLADGEYVPAGCSGGSSKVSFSCPKVTVKDGRASAMLVISSSKYDYVKASGGKYGTASYAGGGVYVNIPIDLNADNRIVGHTTAMGGKEIEYTIHISLDESNPDAAPDPTPVITPEPTIEATPAPTEEAGVDTEHSVETDNKMFKIIRSVLTKKGDEYFATITLSGTGYDKVYCGSAANAAGDSGNWISYSGTYDYEEDGQTKTGYVFSIPVSAVNQPIPLAAHSVKKDEWMDRKVTFNVVLAEATPAPTEAPGENPTATPTPAPTAVILGTPGKVDSSTSLEDGSYAPDKFSWSGGSGRTSISCSGVTVKGGKAYATISFSSDSYAYVKASGSKHYGSVVGGRSTFEIPVKLNANNKIVGMTTAMSADHEIAYTIYVYIEGAKSDTDAALAGADAQIIGLNYVSTDTAEYGKLFKVHRYEGGCAAIDVANVGKYLVAPEGVELPVGIEEEVTVVRQPILRVHSSSEGALQMLQMIFADAAEPAVTAAAWDYSAPDYAALLLEACDLVVVPEIFAEPDAGEQPLAGDAAAAIADVRERLAMLGIPMFVDRSADEDSEAARLEWIKLYGILLGCEEAANACYEAAVAELEVQE